MKSWGGLRDSYHRFESYTWNSSAQPWYAKASLVIPGSKAINGRPSACNLQLYQELYINQKQGKREYRREENKQTKERDDNEVPLTSVKF